MERQKEGYESDVEDIEMMDREKEEELESDSEDATMDSDSDEYGFFNLTICVFLENI